MFFNINLLITAVKNTYYCTVIEIVMLIKINGIVIRYAAVPFLPVPASF